MRDGSVKVIWQSDRDLRCFTAGCVRPVKHRLIGPGGDRYYCQGCMDAERAAGFALDYAERSPLSVYWPDRARMGKGDGKCRQ